MKIEKIRSDKHDITIVSSDEVCIVDVQSALDFMMQVHYETGTHNIIINKKAFIEDFFNLSTKLAGEILQKAANYQFKLAIVGDYTAYTSKSLKDFIYESNRGRYVFFVATVEEALEKLCND